jgi:sugar O-acyltransferase (sialic acid O-acetyltransferase NeuD family)
MIYILGAGSMARETLSIYTALGKSKRICGFIEEKCIDPHKVNGLSVFDASIIDSLPQDSLLIGAMGSPKRKRWIRQIEKNNYKFDTVIDPSVIKGAFVEVLEGSIICPATILTCDIKIGKHTIINNKTSISHDCKIGDFVTISPGVNIGGKVIINNDCFIGIGATIINKINIGKGSYIGAGAVVTRDVPENVLVVGIPAKPIRHLGEREWELLMRETF